MKLRVVGFCFLSSMMGCGSPKGAGVTLLVQKPNGADDSCLGIVGFEVEATAVGKVSKSGPILSSAAVQTLEDCRLARPFVVEALDIESPAVVTVHGFDGAYHARLGGTATIDNLHTEPTKIVLAVEGSPAPPLILDRQTLLAGIALSDVVLMTIETAKGGQPTALLSVAPTADTRAYFDVDPGGFGVDVVDGQELTVGFTFLTGRNVPKQRLVTFIDSTGPVFRAR